MKTLADVPAVVDTNILVYSLDTNARQHDRAKALCDAAAAGKFPGFITTQVVLEYISIVTNPKRVAVPVSCVQAWEDVKEFMTAFSVLPLRVEDIERVASLSQELNLAGPKLFDLGIAVSALGAGINTVYTYDTSVFGRIPGLHVVEP